MKAYSSYSQNSKRALTLAATLLLAACSQAPAQVVMKGSDYYGHGQAPSGIQMASAAVRATPEAKPIYVAPATELVDSAPVGEIAVAELEPVTIEARDLPAPQIRKPEMAAAMPAEQETITATANASAMMPEPQAPALEQVVAEAAPTQGFMWPVDGGKVIAGFGPKAGGTYNDGINIAAREGEPIMAAADGTVMYAGNELRGYGNMVIVKHTGGFVTAYAHTSRMLVRKGDRVKQGEQIALVGKTGNVDRAQLHFSLRKGKEPVNPRDYLRASNFASR